MKVTKQTLKRYTVSQKPKKRSLLKRITAENFSVRGFNALAGSQLLLEGTLLFTDEAYLLRIPNFGRTTLNTAQEIIARNNWKIGGAIETPEDYGITKSEAERVSNILKLGSQNFRNLNIDGDQLRDCHAIQNAQTLCEAFNFDLPSKFQSPVIESDEKTRDAAPQRTASPSTLDGETTSVTVSVAKETMHRAHMAGMKMSDIDAIIRQFAIAGLNQRIEDMQKAMNAESDFDTRTIKGP